MEMIPDEASAWPKLQETTTETMEERVTTFRALTSLDAPSPYVSGEIEIHQLPILTLASLSSNQDASITPFSPFMSPSKRLLA